MGNNLCCKGEHQSLPRNRLKCLRVADAKREIDVGLQPLCLAFAQRRILGFQYNLEFDKRRVLVSSSTDMKILRMNDMGNLTTMKVTNNDASVSGELILAAFLDDHLHNYIL